jgi:D-alanyl-lipoteichoic acid acyltransferase DltB (MBOAT superfamily)
MYFPLGGSRNGIVITVRNTFLIFLVSGFWHGANWTFVLWGILNALYFMPLLLFKRNRINLETAANGRRIPSIKELFSMGGTFLLASFAFIFFRAESAGDAVVFIKKMFFDSSVSMPTSESLGRLTIGVLSIIILIIGEWVNRKEEYGFKRQSKHKLVRWIVYSVIGMTILELSGQGQGFVYFQF